MAKAGLVVRMELGGETAWLKWYGRDRRVLRMRAMDALALRLGVPPLRAPPRHVGVERRDLEQRRLSELASIDVNVPAVLARGGDCLLLSDLGSTLSEHLRREPPERGRELVARAIDAIALVHARGGYLGSPVARNLTVDGAGRIGFIDFEEDPGEVMPLAQAQARDWLVFAAGVARHTPLDEVELGRLLSSALRDRDGQVRLELDGAVRRLSFLAQASAWFGTRAGGVGKALGCLRRALCCGVWAPLLLLATLDLALDGELEVLVLLAGLVD